MSKNVSLLACVLCFLKSPSKSTKSQNIYMSLHVCIILLEKQTTRFPINWFLIVKRNTHELITSTELVPIVYNFYLQLYFTLLYIYKYLTFCRASIFLIFSDFEPGIILKLVLSTKGVILPKNFRHIFQSVDIFLRHNPRHR